MKAKVLVTVLTISLLVGRGVEFAASAEEAPGELDREPSRSVVSAATAVTPAGETVNEIHNVAGLAHDAPMDRHFGSSPLVIKTGQVAWLSEETRSAREVDDFNFATEVLRLITPMTFQEGSKIFVGDEGKNKIVFFEGNPGHFLFRATYDPATKTIVQRTIARD